MQCFFGLLRNKSPSNSLSCDYAGTGDHSSKGFGFLTLAVRVILIYVQKGVVMIIALMTTGRDDCPESIKVLANKIAKHLD